MMSMKLSSPYIFKKVYNDVKIFEDANKEVKIGYLNINGLYHAKSSVFLNTDKNLLQLDFLVVADTRLTEKNTLCELETDLSNWKLIKRFDTQDGIVHMGMIMLQSCASKEEDIVRNLKEKVYFKLDKQKKINFMQVITVSFLKYHITGAFVYIRETPTEAETRKLEKFLNSFDLVMGDLNLDTYRTGDLQKIKILCEQRTKDSSLIFSLHASEITLLITMHQL